MWFSDTTTASLANILLDPLGYSFIYVAINICISQSCIPLHVLSYRNQS